MQRFCELISGPAAVQCSPVLASVEARRDAPPLRASALTPAPRRAWFAFTAGPLQAGNEEKATPLAIGSAGGVLSELRDLGRTEWDRCVIVRGFWVCRTIG